MFRDPQPRPAPYDPPPAALAADPMIALAVEGWTEEVNEPGHQPSARLESETPGAYQAFTLWLNSGLPDARTGVVAGRRSITATAKALGHSQPNTVKRWALKNSWKARAEAIDAALVRQHAAKLNSAADQLGERHQR